MPFVTAGDPDPATSATVFAGLAAAGADLIEIGMPFSDPMADGLAIQEALGCEIARLFPTDGLVGEEGAIGEPPRRARYAWILDPIDGTNNFARGMPGFAVSVGVLRDRFSIGLVALEASFKILSSDQRAPTSNGR